MKSNPAIPVVKLQRIASDCSGSLVAQRHDWLSQTLPQCRVGPRRVMAQRSTPRCDCYIRYGLDAVGTRTAEK